MERKSNKYNNIKKFESFSHLFKEITHAEFSNFFSRKKEPLSLIEIDIIRKIMHEKIDDITLFSYVRNIDGNSYIEFIWHLDEGYERQVIIYKVVDSWFLVNDYGPGLNKNYLCDDIEGLKNLKLDWNK